MGDFVSGKGVHNGYHKEQPATLPLFSGTGPYILYASAECAANLDDDSLNSSQLGGRLVEEATPLGLKG